MTNDVDEGLADQPTSVTAKYISEGTLAKRWECDPKTLQNWRGQGKGPPFYKISGMVRYRLSDIIAHEDACRKSSTSM